jgi:hypothetical protein
MIAQILEKKYHILFSVLAIPAVLFFMQFFVLDASEKNLLYFKDEIVKAQEIDNTLIGKIVANENETLVLKRDQQNIRAYIECLNEQILRAGK